MPRAVIDAFHPGGTVEVVEGRSVPVDNMTTASLELLDVVTVAGTDRRTWSVAAKTLHPATCSPIIRFVPPEMHASVERELDWTVEPHVYRSELGDHLPDGLRMPDLVHLEATGEDRVTLWLELVPDDPSWDLERYRRAARLLGQLAGSNPDGGPWIDGPVRRRDLGYLFFGRIGVALLPPLSDPRIWEHPLLRDHDDHAIAADLVAFAERVPLLLGRMDGLPRTLAHGDASPQNLLLPPGGRDLVAIDFGFLGSMAVGFDLGALHSGRAVFGLLPVDQFGPTLEASTAAYLEGLTDVGFHADEDDVRASGLFAGILQAAFGAIPFERLDEEPTDELQALVERRLHHARFLLDAAATSSLAR